MLLMLLLFFVLSFFATIKVSKINSSIDYSFFVVRCFLLVCLSVFFSFFWGGKGLQEFS